MACGASEIPTNMGTAPTVQESTYTQIRSRVRAEASVEAPSSPLSRVRRGQWRRGRRARIERHPMGGTERLPNQRHTQQSSSDHQPVDGSVRSLHRGRGGKGVGIPARRRMCRLRRWWRLPMEWPHPWVMNALHLSHPPPPMVSVHGVTTVGSQRQPGSLNRWRERRRGPLRDYVRGPLPPTEGAKTP